MRFAPWLTINVMTLYLFFGTEPDILTRIHHHWIGFMIGIVITLIYHGRYSLYRKDFAPKSWLLSSQTRTLLYVLGISTFCSGIAFEIFFSYLPLSVLSITVVACSVLSTAALYFAYYSQSFAGHIVGNK